MIDGVSVTTVDVGLNYASIGGRITDVDGNPISGAEVTITDNDGNQITVTTDSDGNYSAEGSASSPLAGPVTVVVTMGGVQISTTITTIDSGSPMATPVQATAPLPGTLAYTGSGTFLYLWLALGLFALGSFLLGTARLTRRRFPIGR